MLTMKMEAGMSDWSYEEKGRGTHGKSQREP
jgi:hypothetical protein